MNERKIKTPDQSKIEMTQLVLPNDTNWLNNLFIGVIIIISQSYFRRK